MQARVEQDICQGHLQCNFVAPDVFQIGDNGKAVVAAGGLIPEQFEELARDASQVCPEQAITIIG